MENVQVVEENFRLILLVSIFIKWTVLMMVYQETRGEQIICQKGKMWTILELRRLIELRENGKTVAEIAQLMGKSPDAVKHKLRYLGLNVVTIKNSGETTSEHIMSEELISIEEALKKLVAAISALENPKLTKTDVMRMRIIIQTSCIYQKRLAEYIDYRRIESKLIEMDERFAQRAKSIGGQNP